MHTRSCRFWDARLGPDKTKIHSQSVFLTLVVVQVKESCSKKFTSLGPQESCRQKSSWTASALAHRSQMLLCTCMHNPSCSRECEHAHASTHPRTLAHTQTRTHAYTHPLHRLNSSWSWIILILLKRQIVQQNHFLDSRTVAASKCIKSCEAFINFALQARSSAP